MGPTLFQLAAGAAFLAVFGAFVVALAVLVVLVIVWAVRRDRPGREAWRQRQLQAADRAAATRAAPPAADRGRPGSTGAPDRPGDRRP